MKGTLMSSKDDGIRLGSKNMTTHTFKLDARGEHVIVFPNHSRNLIAPVNYEERLDWIRKSYNSFITVVREKDEVRELCNKA